MPNDQPSDFFARVGIPKTAEAAAKIGMFIGGKCPPARSDETPEVAATLPPAPEVRALERAPRGPRARTGKIARLPHAMREEINQRLLDGQLVQVIVNWIHAQPEFKELAAQFPKIFNGKITAENVSEWRFGGYQDWLRERQSSK